MPLWGMHTVRERIFRLVESYTPDKVILVGDIVDGAGSADEAMRFFDRLEEFGPELICIAGNHDRGEIREKVEFVDTWREHEFFFHHGHQLPPEDPGDATIEITGHLHPSVTLRDGAGLRLKLPAFVQTPPTPRQPASHWILPAFSPWAGGTTQPNPHPHTKTWACHPHHIFPH